MAKIPDAGDDVAKKLESRLRRLSHTTSEASRLYAQGQLTQRSLDAIAESSFIASYAAFELFLEDLFYSVLVGESGISGAGGVVPFATRTQAEGLIVSRGQYLKWLPYKNGIKENADRFLIHSSPFDRLTRSDTEMALLDEAQVLRNAVSHLSASATRKAEKYTSTMGPRRRTIAGYLESSAQGKTNYEVLVDNFRSVSKALVEPSESKARAFLSPERPYKNGDKPGIASYRCVTCQATHPVRSSGIALPKCSACNGKSGIKSSSWRRIW